MNDNSKMDVEEIDIGGDAGDYSLEHEEEEVPEDEILQTHFATDSSEPPAKAESEPEHWEL